MEKIAQKNCVDFVDVLASKAAVPGGGGAAALAGAIGMALGSMVCNLTTGKKKYAQYEEAIQEILVKAGKLQEELLSMIDKDAEGFIHYEKLMVFLLQQKKKNNIKLKQWKNA